jgi:hypothetical protein
MESQIRGAQAVSLGPDELARLGVVGFKQKKILNLLRKLKQDESTPAESSSEEEEDETPCVVCGEAEGGDGENNQFLFCGDGESTGCNMAVHQDCYAVYEGRLVGLLPCVITVRARSLTDPTWRALACAAVPEGDWLCYPCAQGVDNKTVRCRICPDFNKPPRNCTPRRAAAISLCAKAHVEKSAFMPVGGHSEREREGWVHAKCAMWLPETVIEEDGSVLGFGNIDKVGSVG